jgi:glycosyltransferase involved in cell wall biosynthesis
MKIAYVSYEFIGETGFGGIATYLGQVTQMMAMRNHDVYVFTSTIQETHVDSSFHNIEVHRIKSTKENFSREVAMYMKSQIDVDHFDLIELPDYGADGYDLISVVDANKLVLKLHTPSFLIDKINPAPLPKGFDLFRMYIGAWRRGKIAPVIHNMYDKSLDKEYKVAQYVRHIYSPSTSLARIVQQQWNITEDKISIQPYPFIPSRTLLDIPIKYNQYKNIITFIGRLEIRKGLLDIIKVLPIVVKQFPDVTFQFIGSPMHSPDEGLNMQDYIWIKLKNYRANLKFLGKLSLDQMITPLSETNICVFPSKWENFPNVCLESMSAGRAIIGSKEGGMSEQLSGGAGLTCTPGDYKDLAEKIIYLLSHPNLIEEYGNKARSRVLLTYNESEIGKLTEQQYKKLLNRINE